MNLRNFEKTQCVFYGKLRYKLPVAEKNVAATGYKSFQCECFDLLLLPLSATTSCSLRHVDNNESKK